MDSLPRACLDAIDAWAAAALPCLAVWILLSGLDDLVLVLVLLSDLVRRRLTRRPEDGCPHAGGSWKKPEKRLAVFVPLWREDAVIGRMIEHNIASIRYRNYDFFVGAYPNDEKTVEAASDLEERFANVHLAMCPHDGPTSKADCLNWIYQHMLLFEEKLGEKFAVVVTHDAEDVIHPDSFGWINYYAGAYDMVQIPVLPMARRRPGFTYGVYCDEFAEYQMKDIPARQILGGFIPSNGVGTGYTRAALEKLAARDANRIFDPASLTEDYENGFRLRQLGRPQRFVLLAASGHLAMATREYFPHRYRQAVPQRTRWVTGIALQGWERHGWSGGLRQVYWLWRDRKGLVGNPVGLLTNALFLYGVASWLWSGIAGLPWGLARAAWSPTAYPLLGATLALQCVHVGTRVFCAAWMYGWAFALLSPLRAMWANWINSVATVNALARYARARWRREPLVWLKTEHAYPSRSALVPRTRLLGEILAGSHYISRDDLEAALASRPPGLRLGEHLVRLGKITEQELYEALSLQYSVPLGALEPREVPRHMAWALPAHLVQRWKVLPFKVLAGHLFLAAAELPSEEMQRELRGFTRLEIRFQLITRSNFEQLRTEVLQL